MRPVSKEPDEICYPFIYEDSPVCDFEITADELCSRIGLILSMELDSFSRDILTRMQPNLYHVNGSVRGKLAITQAELDELKSDYAAIKAHIDGGFKGFVLPGGHPVASQLHLCRCLAKKVVRALVVIEHSGTRQPDPILFRYANLLANVLYSLASYVNHTQQVQETEFVSRSYTVVKK
ncbi:ATP:cob(I)alamin adenosyltransferase [Vibrio sp. CAU 1672]|uniref:ATP:cob(I)alamin adenosyltransferase n=1 Tax=Vibrio sp. CAU 1672 TaxID=3032594 RepID=UPI0023DBE985|nr:ATP:cob(I)alamin adenosyltransferase [Vibrio sp. CAU 1672]MDF2155139.1 ATP:cob(I)alamin adenosyltransferase [Vibrio sp. CAU 1672]